MIPTIYNPTWIDQFGLFTQKSFLMVVYNSFATGGKVIGYGLVNYFGEENVNHINYSYYSGENRCSQGDYS